MHRFERGNRAELLDRDAVAIAGVRNTMHEGGPPARPRYVQGVLLAVAGLLIFGAPLVAAHEGGPRVLISPDRVGPGGVVDVRGEDLGPDATVVLALIGETGEVPLGQATADGEGHINAAVALPAELPVGTYRLRATTVGGGQLDAIVIVEGVATSGGGEPGEKDEDDALLFALPSGWQRSLSGPIVTARPQTETLPAGSAAGGGDPLAATIAIAVAIAAGLGSVMLVVGQRLRVRRRERSREA